MKDTEALTCWSCQVHSAIARLRDKPFRFCHRCEDQMRQAQQGWSAWGRTVAGAPTPQFGRRTSEEPRLSYH